VDTNFGGELTFSKSLFYGIAAGPPLLYIIILILAAFNIMKQLLPTIRVEKYMYQDLHPLATR
jgi:hypothetical protein